MFNSTSRRYFAGCYLDRRLRILPTWLESDLVSPTELHRIGGLWGGCVWGGVGGGSRPKPGDYTGPREELRGEINK